MTDRQSGRRPGAERRRQIAAAARKLFERDGFQRTSVSAIVREAGVAQGTFYLYFQSKEQVLARLRGEVLADYVASFRAGAAGESRADARLVRGLARIERAVRRNQDTLRVIRQASSGEETEQVWIQGRETLAEPLGELIREGCAQGCFRVDDPRLAAHLVLALFDDLLYEAAEYKKPAGSRTTLAHGSRFLLRALGASEERVAALVPLRRRSA